MKTTHDIFLDSDVVISSMLSSKGAAFQVMKSQRKHCFISNVSLFELEIVRNRLSIDKKLFDQQIKQLSAIEIKRNNDIYEEYVYDENDKHVVEGAVACKARFLITYNLKHYDTEKIKRDFLILVMTPGNFLQYLRSQE